jgi:hypothetical protein
VQYSLGYDALNMWPVGGLEAEELRFQTIDRHYTTSCIAQSNAPEDGRNNCPKHVELIRIINIQLLLHLDGCLSYYLTQKGFLPQNLCVTKVGTKKPLLFCVYFSSSRLHCFERLYSSRGVI